MVAAADYEKLGTFYLGRRVAEDGEPSDEPVLYDSRDLTTHGVIVGMTGSGKTGLSVGILEEAAIDGIPSLVIDPKGDMGNLMLTFPQLRPEDFEPWVDPAEATRNGRSTAEYAADTAELWKNGLAEWGQEPSRIQRFREAAEVSIYTPGATSGLSLSVLRSFAAPGEAVRDDPDALRERTQSAVSGLLSLLGIEADPLQSREHILISNILDHSWRDGQDLDLAGMIRAIVEPPFDRLGVMDLETFLPAKERSALAMSLNNLLASPGFSAWMEGAPLDIGNLLYGPDGRPKISVISIAHLSDAERMFVVTLILNEMVSWMRSQTGTSSLRALLYMDEIFGFFPPTANPPSKVPMLTLLKQARAYGVGVLLATQNPVDLDYKGLSNCGSWFIGRLQTERDRARVLGGLEGASTDAGRELDKSELEETIGRLGKRRFLLNNVHEDAPVVLETRWVLSYLRGPLVRAEIQRLMEGARRALTRPTAKEKAREASANKVAAEASEAAERPQLPAAVVERFLRPQEDLQDNQELVYRPMMFGAAEMHFKRTSVGLDDWREIFLVAPIEEGSRSLSWEEAARLPEEPKLWKRPEKGARFAPLAAPGMREKSWSAAAKKMSSELYRTQLETIWKHPGLKQYSEPGETEGDFRRRIQQDLKEARDLAVEKLRQSYAKKLESLEGKLLTARQRVEKEKVQLKDSKRSALVNVGVGVLGTLMGRKKLSATAVRRAGMAIRGFGRSSKDREDVEHAEEKLEVLLEQQTELEAEAARELDALRERLEEADTELERIDVRPLKTDIAVNQQLLLWTPWSLSTSGIAQPLFDTGEPLDA